MEIPQLTPEILNRERAALEREIADLEPKRKRLALINELLALYPSRSTNAEPVLLDVAPKSEKKLYCGMGVTDAIFKCLAAKYPDFSKPGEIRDALLAGGFATTSPNFTNVVFTTCKRLHESGKIDKGDKNGNAAFRLNKGSGNNGGPA